MLSREEFRKLSLDDHQKYINKLARGFRDEGETSKRLSAKALVLEILSNPIKAIAFITYSSYRLLRMCQPFAIAYIAYAIYASNGFG